MPHSIPFFILITTSVLIFFSVLLHTKDKKLIILLFFMIGMAYTLEYVILVLFNSYQYDPNFTSNEYFDNLFGSLTSQAFTFPIMAVFVAAYQLKFRYIIFISLMFMGIEELFIHLGLYKQHWWKTIYTGIFMTIGFMIAKVWYVWLSERFSKWIHFTTLYLSMTAVNTTIMLCLIAMLHTHTFQVEWFQSDTRDLVNINTIYVYGLTLLYIWAVIRHSLLFIIMSILSFRLLDVILIHYHILELAKWNSLFLITILDLGVIALIARFNHFILKNCYGTDRKKVIAFMNDNN
ncbi:hypothetical protein FZC66_11910 [Priestia megaterium]|nr:hypothetical protein FZC66_11910 [Priestia megaterium]